MENIMWHIYRLYFPWFSESGDRFCVPLSCILLIQQYCVSPRDKACVHTYSLFSGKV